MEIVSVALLEGVWVQGRVLVVEVKDDDSNVGEELKQMRFRFVEKRQECY